MPNSAPNFKAIQSMHELKWFQKMLQKEEKCKESKKNLKRCISWEWLGRVSSNMELKVPTLREFVLKNLCASVLGVLSYRCVKKSFSSFLYNIHTCLSRALDFLGRTTICLDKTVFNLGYCSLLLSPSCRTEKHCYKDHMEEWRWGIDLSEASSHYTSYIYNVDV